VGRTRERGQIMHRAGAEIDVRQHQHRHVFIERCLDVLRLDATQLIALPEQRAQPLGDVQVSRKIAPLRENHAALRPELERHGQQLEQIDRRRIAGQRLAWLRADQPADLVADATRRLQPPGGVPAADQPLTPLALDHLGHARGGDKRQRTERVAIQIDHALGQPKARAAVTHGIFSVQLFDIHRVHAVIVAEPCSRARIHPAARRTPGRR
jgi:hypothetical protein